MSLEFGAHDGVGDGVPQTVRLAHGLVRALADTESAGLAIGLVLGYKAPLHLLAVPVQLHLPLRRIHRFPVLASFGAPPLCSLRPKLLLSKSHGSH